jgi:hypothetical protein
MFPWKNPARLALPFSEKMLVASGAAVAIVALIGVAGCKTRRFDTTKSASAFTADPLKTDPCRDKAGGRFRGKVPEFYLSLFGRPDDTLQPMGPSGAKRNQETPWVDWAFFDGVDNTPRSPGALGRWVKVQKGSSNSVVQNLASRLDDVLERGRTGQSFLASEAGVLAALLTLELQRIDLLECSMWDTGGAADTYVPGKINQNTTKKWESYQFAAHKGIYKDDAGADRATCTPADLRFRTMDGTCNDADNPTMGAVQQRFSRNVSFEAARPTPDLPSPSEVSKVLLARPDVDILKKPVDQFTEEDWQKVGRYRQAPFFNLIAASWIQFMTHDWFSHARKGRNDDSRSIEMGDGSRAPASLRDPSPQSPAVSSKHGKPGVGTFANTVTFWWDASQVYGWDDVTTARVRDGQTAFLRLDANGMLPRMQNLCDDKSALAEGLHPHECSQGLAAFTDNWWVGMSLLHTAFAREHNRFVRELQQQEPGYNDDELFQYGRLYVAALIAKIHTIEWTPQLLFNPVLEKGMESNWHGIIGSRLGAERKEVTAVREKVGELVNTFNRQAEDSSGPFRLGSLGNLVKATDNNFLFAFLAALPGATAINKNLFGAPYALPEEFTAVYRLHPLLPDVLERRSVKDGAVVGRTEGDFERVLTRDTALGLAENLVTNDTVADWWLSLGSQRTGTLQLDNYPRFMHNLLLAQNPQGQQVIDLAALEIARDRERGIPRHSELRANIGLTPLKDFNDFVDLENAFQVYTKCAKRPFKKYAEFRDEMSQTSVAGITCGTKDLEARRQALLVQIYERDRLKQLYKGNINAVDTLVGWLAENTRPHGFALAETQFQIFILNASRRLFSDRFFTNDFNAKTYTAFGIEQLRTRGMRDVLVDNFKEDGLDKLLFDQSSGKFRIANAFDPWTRPRKGYALDWGYDPVGLHGTAK